MLSSVCSLIISKIRFLNQSCDERGRVQIIVWFDPKGLSIYDAFGSVVLSPRTTVKSFMNQCSRLRLRMLLESERCVDFAFAI